MEPAIAQIAQARITLIELFNNTLLIKGLTYCFH